MPATHFLNVDLDIYSTRDLQPLVTHLGRKVIVLYVGREHGKNCAHLEFAKSTTTADSAIRALCRLIEALPKPERSLWDTASVRSFSIGIQAGNHPNPCDSTIQPMTIRVLSALGSQLVVTIYPPEAAPSLKS